MLRYDTCTVEALPSNDIWYGVTYQENDVARKEAFEKMLEEEKNKEDLFLDL